MISERGKVLRDLISDYSEDNWSAGWLDRIEYKIWYDVNDREDYPPDPEQERIVNLAKEWGIWVVWDEDMDWIDGHKVREIPISEWLEIYQAVLSKLKIGKFHSRIIKFKLNYSDD